MPLELHITFPDSTHVSVALLGGSPDFSQPADFKSPLDEKALHELGWYVEKYGTSYAAEPDDERAAAVRDKLPEWGAKLFTAIFKGNDKADNLFRDFLYAAEEGRVLSIAADHPAVLALPWELLCTPGGSYLFNEQPPISIRRGLPSAGQGRSPQPRAAKPCLHLLFIVSRPDGAGFINPRSDAEAVLSALEQQDAARVEVEFLQPPTLEALRQRLRDERRPKIDIIHFDGHGSFGKAKGKDNVGKGEYTKDGGAAADKQQGWLLFEDEDGNEDHVSAQEFGELLFRNQAGLVVLSACQSAKMSSEDAMSGTAARLVHAGIPAVIAMSHSVLVTTAERLFAEFYRHLFQGRSVARSLDEARHALRFKPERGIRLRGADGAEEFKLELHDWFLPTLYQSGNDMALLSAAGADSLPPKVKPLHNLPDVQLSGFFGRSRELWEIERAFAVEGCQRFSITGFGGQGKTALALEAGRWLLRTKLFKRACFISYASYQGSDPVSMAISTMSAVLQESLVDAAAAQASLKRQLLQGYWQAYYQLSGMLYQLDSTQPHAARAIAQQELPNMLRAVYATLQTSRSEEGVDFAERVNYFLRAFGMQRDYQFLAEAAAKAGGTVGSQAWFLSRSNLGEQLRQSGQTAAAAQVFEDILAGLEQTPSYNRCLTLGWLGRCFESKGQPAQAEQRYGQALTEIALLEQSDGVQRQTGAAWTDLADVLAAQGRYTEAKTAYQAGLEITEKLGDKRNTGVVLGQLGTLAYRQGELAEAEERYKEALSLFQSIGEPASEAVLWHQLGMVYQDAEHWEAAEQAYRQSARLEEERGGEAGMIGAGASWDQLAQLCEATGRQAEAEQWYSKALKARRAADDRPGIARALNNLADLLANQPARLDEARGYAEESRDIKQTLNPAAAQIWTTYNILADIATQQGDGSQAAAYRAKSRQAYFAFPGWRQQLYQHEELIAAVIKGSGVEAALEPYGEAGVNVRAAIQRILNGERDEAALCGPLGWEEAAVIRAILQGIGGGA